MWSGRTLGKSGDRYIASMVTIPKAPEIMAKTDVVESRNSLSRSLGLKAGSRKTSNAVKTAASTGSRTASITTTVGVVG